MPRAERPPIQSTVLRAPRRTRAAAKTRRVLGRVTVRPLRATTTWWGRHRFALFVTATPATAVAAAAVTWGRGAALATAAVGCAFMAYMSDDGTDDGPGV